MSLIESNVFCPTTSHFPPDFFLDALFQSGLGSVSQKPNKAAMSKTSF